MVLIPNESAENGQSLLVRTLVLVANSREIWNVLRLMYIVQEGDHFTPPLLWVGSNLWGYRFLLLLLSTLNNAFMVFYHHLQKNKSTSIDIFFKNNNIIFFQFQVTFIDQQHPELPIAEPLVAVPRNFFPSRTRVKLIEGYSDPKDTRSSRSGRTATTTGANKPHRHHSQSGGNQGGAVAGQVTKGDFRNYSNLTAPVPKTRNKSRNNGEKGAAKRNRRKVSDSGKLILLCLVV